MVVNWIVPSQPLPIITNGMSDLHFVGTVGWCWEEATWAGGQTGPGDVFYVGPLLHVGGAQALVISPEGLVPSLVSIVPSLPTNVRLLLRCVGAPWEENEVWDAVSAICPRLDGVAVLSEREKSSFMPWARVRGFKGEASVVPLGATEVVPLPTAQRSGVAFLGRPFWNEKGVGLLAQAAKALPDIPFFFAFPMGSEQALREQVQAELKKLPNTHVVTCGIRGRAALLQKVRVVAARGTTDWQWLPGTEIRGARGVGMAAKGSPIEDWNGAGLMYFDGVGELVDKVRFLHHSDAGFELEAARQHQLFTDGGFDSLTVGRKLLNWAREARSGP